jgi:hypothetical protein
MSTFEAFTGLPSKFLNTRREILKRISNMHGSDGVKFVFEWSDPNVLMDFLRDFTRYYEGAHIVKFI